MVRVQKCPPPFSNDANETNQVLRILSDLALGGGFKYFFNAHPYILGETINFDLRIFSKWVGEFNHQIVAP